MVKTFSQMVELGSQAPDFELIDAVSGNNYKLNDFNSQTATVIAFICNHCPFVIHINEKLVQVANHYMAKGIKFVAINANDIDNYPDDSPDKMKLTAKQLSYPFPYLFDETQQVAKAYRAACTPDFFVYDKEFKLSYRGQFDQATPGNDKPVDGSSLSAVLDSMLAGESIEIEQRPSVGCNIKWKADNV